MIDLEDSDEVDQNSDKNNANTTNNNLVVNTVNSNENSEMVDINVANEVYKGQL